MGTLRLGPDRLGRTPLTPGRTRTALVFTAPSTVEIRLEEVDPVGDGQVLVRTLESAISAGTELMIYRGLAPADLPADASLSSLAGGLSFPLKYGYSAVGRVVELGRGVDPWWRDRLVFAFQPHQSSFTSNVTDLTSLPDGVGPDDGVFLPNTETAVGLVHDGAPLAGERIVIFGQGVVGLLTTALLARMSPSQLITLDRFENRRQASLRFGAHLSLDPTAGGAAERIHEALSSAADHPGADLTYELSGDPAVLNAAIATTGDDGRVVIGSWYGRRTAPLDLGGRFHRSRIRLISSQVSTLAPALSGRWAKTRRLAYALSLLGDIRPGSLITHRIPFPDAAQAFHLLDENPAEALQVVLVYPEA